MKVMFLPGDRLVGFDAKRYTGAGVQTDHVIEVVGSDFLVVRHVAGGLPRLVGPAALETLRSRVRQVSPPDGIPGLCEWWPKPPEKEVP